MLIGNQYADNKLYRGIQHYDTMPLTSGDLHEYSDTAYMKNAYIMNNLLGYGVLNNPPLIATDAGISLSSPSVVMIDGDISLIQSDEGSPLVSKDPILNAGYEEGVLCILGWYQHLNSTSTLRNYGGVDNSVLENDLVNETFNVQISSRYQLRWFPILVDRSDLEDSTSITISFKDRNAAGDELDTSTTVTSSHRENDVVIFEKPADMEYAESDLYLVPIGYYALSDGEITHVESAEKLSVTSKVAMLQYQSIHVIATAEGPANVVIPINISGISEGDILSVSYESLLLYKGEHYTVNYEDNTITLLNFRTNVGDMVYFTLTKLVDAKNVSSLSAMFTDHTHQTANSTTEGHIKLTDTISDSDTSDGIAATPKLVNSVATSLDSRIARVESAIAELEKRLV